MSAHEGSSVATSVIRKKLLDPPGGGAHGHTGDRLEEAGKSGVTGGGGRGRDESGEEGGGGVGGGQLQGAAAKGGDIGQEKLDGEARGMEGAREVDLLAEAEELMADYGGELAPQRRGTSS